MYNIVISLHHDGIIDLFHYLKCLNKDENELRNVGNLKRKLIILACPVPLNLK